MTNSDDSSLARGIDRTRSLVLNVLVLDGLSILATALVLRRWAPLDVEFDRGILKGALLAALFSCFIVARIILRTPRVRLRSDDQEGRLRAYCQSRVGTAVAGWLALPLGAAYGLIVDPTLAGVAPFWVAAMLLGATALPRRSDVAELEDPHATATEPDA